MHSPTGYYAIYTVHLAETEIRSVFPIVHWNSDGFPVIANPGGHLITVSAHGMQTERNFSTSPGDDCYVSWIVSPLHTD